MAKAQVWMQGASDEQVAATIAPYFPGLPTKVNAAVIKRYRSTGAPIWSESTVIDRVGLAKLQEIMIIGGVLSIEKIVAHETIVASDVALQAQRLLQPR